MLRNELQLQSIFVRALKLCIHPEHGNSLFSIQHVCLKLFIIEYITYFKRHQLDKEITVFVSVKVHFQTYFPVSQNVPVKFQSENALARKHIL